MNHIYFRNLLKDLWTKKFFVLLFVILCMGLLAFFGYRSAKAPSTLSEAEQQELDDYKQKLSDYDSQIQELSENLAAQKSQIDDFKVYMDNSIYMKLDPQNHAIATVNFTIANPERLDLLVPAMTDYVNNGAMTEDISALAKEEFSIYWKEMTWCGSSGTVFTICTRNCTEDDANAVMDYISTAVKNKIPDWRGLYGNFDLAEDRSSYPAQDAGIASEQYNKQNTMTSYDNTYADLQNRLSSTKEGKRTFIEEKTPKSANATPANVLKTVLIYAVFGVIAGFVLSCIFFLFKYILGDGIHSSRDLADYGLLHFTKASEIAFLADKKQWKQLSLLPLSESETAKSLMAEQESQLNELFSSTNCQLSPFSFEAEGCVLVLEAGRTTYHALDEQLARLEKCGIQVLGYLMCE